MSPICLFKWQGECGGFGAEKLAILLHERIKRIEAQNPPVADPAQPAKAQDKGE